jgi:NitT/TauT family transport system substrate-binding protein
MTDEFTTTRALGWIDAERMKKDYELVHLSRHGEAVRREQRVLDQNAGCVDKMDASKVKK